MKELKLRRLKLENFKGIKRLDLDFTSKETNIYGANASGKTTIMDSFLWLLFGKDSTDRKTFEVKRLDSNNNVIHKLEHSVEAIIEVDGTSIEIKRVLRERWVKKRGVLEPKLEGNTQSFFWNEVPLQASEFTNKVNELVDETVFKMITNPLAFNSLKWQDQREILTAISGELTMEEIAGNNKDFQNLLEKISNKTLEEYKKEVAMKLRNTRNELKMLPTRIDEVERSKPEALDFANIESEIKEQEKVASEIDSQILDKSKAFEALQEKFSKKQEEIYSLKSKVSEIKFKAREQAVLQWQNETSEINQKSVELENLKKEKSSNEQSLERLEEKHIGFRKDHDELVAIISQYRKEWEQANAQEFVMNEGDKACPTCHREFDEEKLSQKIKEARTNFNNQKIDSLDSISRKGKEKSNQLKRITREIDTVRSNMGTINLRIERLEKSISETETELKDLQDKAANSKTVEQLTNEIVESNSEIPAIQDRINALNEELESKPEIDYGSLKSDKQEALNRISELKVSLQLKEQISKADARINELMEQESQLAQQIADTEREQFTLENFVKAKIDKLESVINSKFSLVKFKMFETQINGGEVETCKAMVNGVPFSDINSASKINAGIDIINTLCNHYQVSAPIFVDNRESVSQLIDSNSQIINLIVSEQDSKLRIEPVND